MHAYKVTISVLGGHSVVKGVGWGECEVAIFQFYCTIGSCWEGQGALQLCNLAEL